MHSCILQQKDATHLFDFISRSRAEAAFDQDLISTSDTEFYDPAQLDRSTTPSYVFYSLLTPYDVVLRATPYLVHPQQP